MIADGMRDSFAQSRRTARVMGFSCEMSLSECRMFQTMGGRDGSILCAAVAASTAWCIQPMSMSGRTRREIGNATCGERGCVYGENQVVAVPVKTKMK